jgi:hypothetical protein
VQWCCLACQEILYFPGSVCARLVHAYGRPGVVAPGRVSESNIRPGSLTHSTIIHTVLTLCLRVVCTVQGGLQRLLLSSSSSPVVATFQTGDDTVRLPAGSVTRYFNYGMPGHCDSGMKIAARVDLIRPPPPKPKRPAGGRSACPTALPPSISAASLATRASPELHRRPASSQHHQASSLVPASLTTACRSWSKMTLSHQTTDLDGHGAPACANIIY